MAVRIVPFTPDLLPAVIRFSRSTWIRPQDESYFRWRYLECPSQFGTLAMDDGECLAMVWAYRRPYRIGGTSVPCLETFDWFARPELRGSLVGIRLMHSVMRHPEPIIAVGGSAHTLGLLPRLEWRPVGQVTQYALPLLGGAVGRNLKRRFGIPAAWARAAFRASARHWFIRGASRAPLGEVAPALEIGPEIAGLYEQETGYALLPVPELGLARWMLRGPADLGELILLRFRVGECLRGWSLSRVYGTGAQREAAILELFAPGGDEALYAWMVAETVASLSPHGPDTIHAAASAPPLEAALRRRRFVPVRRLPVHVWPGGLDLPALPLHLGNNTSDIPIFPYATQAPEPTTAPGTLGAAARSSGGA